LLLKSRPELDKHRNRDSDAAQIDVISHDHARLSQTQHVAVNQA